MKDKRSNKWAFLIYKDSVPKNYKDELDAQHIPYVLSPWHDKDINKDTGELKKPHRHGCFYFDSLKSYSQVSALVSDILNGPGHVEVVQSPKGMYDYFVHADNPDKTQYNVDEIESGCGFNLTRFLQEQNEDEGIAKILDFIEAGNIVEFRNLVACVRNKDEKLLGLVTQRAYFFSKYLDSKRNTMNHGNKK
ncbi:replication protein [Limosilactobacillus reuteri]|uniref:replication protein n=1 Tax=Limosilactobacillus reuteri TaxID=1598 RepID=UPI00128C9F50|nr:replication protein [Limosilactobacillus reuteri]MQB69408.1 Replication protein RepB [Limosilactobacillus reuteri]MQC04755.1 Replication protein RepB [Limosilactobacillus reuteri]